MEFASQCRHVPGDTAKIGHDGRCLGHQPDEPRGRARSDQHGTLGKRACPLFVHLHDRAGDHPEKPRPHLPGSTRYLPRGATPASDDVSMRRGRDCRIQRRRSPSIAHSISWGPLKWASIATAMRARESTSSSLMHGSDVSSQGSGSSRTPPVGVATTIEVWREAFRKPDSKLGVELDTDRLRRRPAIHQTRPRPLTTWTRTTGHRPRGSAVYTTPLATASVRSGTRPAWRSPRVYAVVDSGRPRQRRGFRPPSDRHRSARHASR